MNLREALVCSVESTESAHGADREGSALWRAREVGLRVVNRLEEKAERRRRAQERKVERIAQAKRATRDVRWVNWERELLGRSDGRLVLKRERATYWPKAVIMDGVVCEEVPA